MLSSLRSPVFLVLILALLVVFTAGGAGLVERIRWSDPDYGLKKGEEAIERKQYDEVERAISRLEAAGFPDHAYLLRGKEWIAKGERTRAIEALRHVAESSPLAIDSMLLEAECLYNDGQIYQAQQRLTQVVGQAPDNPVGHWKLAAVYDVIFAWNDVLRECDEVARLDDRDGKAHGFKGLIYSRLKEYDKAATAYRDALARNLSDRRRNEVYAELADTLLKLHDAAAAEELVKKLPDAADPLTRLTLTARCDWDLDRRDRAVTSLQKGLPSLGRTRASMDVEYTDAQILLGRYLLDTNNANQALENLQRLQARVPPNPEIGQLLLRAFHDLKMEKEEEEQRKLLEPVDKFYRDIDELQHKAYADRLDRMSRARVAVMWDKIRNEDLARRWNDAAIATVVP
jgi:tetratricopeptide (TPR) repeat protein